MQRRAFLAGAVALPLSAVAKAAPTGGAKRVSVTFPLIFRKGDENSYFREGRMRTTIDDKMQLAIASVLKANPHLRPDLKRKVSFTLQGSDGQPWGRPGPVSLPATTVFKKTSTAPRNVIIAKSLAATLRGEAAPAIDQLSRVAVKAVFHVAQV